MSPRKYRKEFFWSIIGSPGIALPTLKIMFCVGNARQVSEDFAQKIIKKVAVPYTGCGYMSQCIKMLKLVSYNIIVSEYLVTS